jgi:sugar phosphate isomerase/epimerase
MSRAKMVVVETTSEGATSVGKSIINLSSLTTVGLDLWWKEFFSVVGMVGYNGWVSLEMEDFTMSTEAGIRTSVDALQATISR